MVDQIYEFLTLIFRKGPEFIAVGFLGLVGGVTLTAFGPRWLRRLLLPQIVDSTQRKIDKLEEEVKELKQVADQTLDSTQIKAGVSALSVLTVGDLTNVQKEFLGSAVGKNKTEKMESLENAIMTFARSQHRTASIHSS